MRIGSSSFGCDGLLMGAVRSAVDHFDVIIVGDRDRIILDQQYPRRQGFKILTAFIKIRDFPIARRPENIFWPPGISCALEQRGTLGDSNPDANQKWQTDASPSQRTADAEGAPRGR